MKPNPVLRRRGDLMREENARILARLNVGGLFPERVLSEPEVAAILGTCTRTVGRLVKANKAPPRVELSPGRFGFLFGDVQIWLAARRSEQDDVPAQNAESDLINGEPSHASHPDDAVAAQFSPRDAR